MMKLTDYVIDFFAKRAVHHGFVLQGGAVAHIIDSGEKNEEFTVVPMQHEQAAAMAADAYARVSSAGVGLAMSTSGPGATNLITGIACSYYDSISTFFITGNVASFRQSDRIGVRQYGFQETDITQMCKPITKYAVRLSSPQMIRYELEKAYHVATSGRPGPVLVDIPDDFQREIIDVEALPVYQHDSVDAALSDVPVDFNSAVSKLIPLIQNAKRPVFVFGAGIQLAGCEHQALQLAETLNIPFLYTWALKGVSNWSDSLCAGTFGTNSPRYGNFAVQNADLIICIGSRLDTHATGKIDWFARQAVLVVVDIDNAELTKFERLGRPAQYSFCADAETFISTLDSVACQQSVSVDCKLWIEQIQRWKKQYQPKLAHTTSQIDPYHYFNHLAEQTAHHRFFTLDTGAGLAYFMANYFESKGQRVITAFNNTPMGYSLPAAIGVAFATAKCEPVICITGDGGLQMNIQELATVAYHQLPIKIIVVNNAGHTMIKQTQDDWLESNYFGSSTAYGLPLLDFKSIANAYGLHALVLDKNSDSMQKTAQLLSGNKPCLMDMLIDPDIRIDPMITWGRPLEDSSPILSRDELKANMYVPIIDIPVAL